MDGRSQRLFASLSLLAMLWVVVYWAWDPGEGPAKISFDARPPVDSSDVIATPVPFWLAADQTNDDPSVLPGAILGETTASVAPEFRDYLVRSNDTLETIARRELGDASLWRTIARANPLRDPNRIKPGDIIRLPLDPSNIQGGTLSAAADPESTEQADEVSYVEYIVQRGDVLGEIAQQYYGRASMATFIFEHNRDTLSSMDDLKLGQTLRLPPASANP